MAPSKRKFYRTRFTVEIMSEDPIPDGAELCQLLHECDTGDCVLHSISSETFEETGEHMAKLLVDCGSDESFFQLTSLGEDTDDLLEDEPDYEQYRCVTGDETVCEPCQLGQADKCVHVANARKANE